MWEIIFLISILFYVIMILGFARGVKNLPVFNSKAEKRENKQPAGTLEFSVLIPFRNEAQNLPKLLNSLLHLKYHRAKFEVFLVNDASTDNSEAICQQFITENPNLPLKLLQNYRNSKSPKKQAIVTAAKNAQFQYLLCTDADCILPPNWLTAFSNGFLKTKADFLAGPVSSYSIATENNATGLKKALFAFEALDFMSLQASGAGAFAWGRPFLCNGANIAYRKKTFFEIGAFSGNEHIASGDDVFLLQKFKQRALKIAFLKDRSALVTTKAPQSLRKMLSQRIRWAAKTSAYNELFPKMLGILVAGINFLWIIGIFNFIFDGPGLQFFSVFFIAKATADFILLFQFASFFKQENILVHFIWAYFLYPFFTIYVAVASQFLNFNWKGREFKR